jgi:DNA adenine methylase
MYDWCISLQDNEWNYTINRTDDQKNGLKLEHGYQSERRKGKEVFIANYDLEKPARFTPLQLSLFDGY